MTRLRLTCDEAVALLLDADEDAKSPDLVAHLTDCGECQLVARDVTAFRMLVAQARADVESLGGAPDVLAALGARGAGSEAAPDAQRAFRLVQGGASAPVTPAARRVSGPRRAIPIALAVAAALVAVTAAAVLLQHDGGRLQTTPRVVLRDTGERPDAPARPAEPVDAPAVAVTAPAPAPAPPLDETAQRGACPKEPPAHQRRSAPSAPSPRSTPGTNTSQMPTAGAPELEAQRTLRRQMPRLQNCYERALRRDLRLGDATADITVDIDRNGGVQTIAVSGDATPELRRCLEQAVRNARFPNSDTGLRVSVPLRFEVVRERMGTNIAPHGTARE